MKPFIDTSIYCRFYRILLMGYNGKVSDFAQLSCNFRFLSKMQHGFADYGCCIQTEKTVTNFDWRSQVVSSSGGSGSTNKPENPSVNGEIRPYAVDPKQGIESVTSDLSELSFCGSLIDPLSLRCRPDFSSYFGRNIVYASTLNCWYSFFNFTPCFVKAWPF